VWWWEGEYEGAVEGWRAPSGEGVEMVGAGEEEVSAVAAVVCVYLCRGLCLGLGLGLGGVVWGFRGGHGVVCLAVCVSMGEVRIWSWRDVRGRGFGKCSTSDTRWK
jgi:hypothetical protein